jgi:NADH-quinone oxidoreductase subunit F
MSYNDLQQKALESWATFTDDNTPRILIGTGTCGKAAGADDLLPAIKAFIKKNLPDAILCETGCLGLCYAEPLIELRNAGTPSVLCGNLTADTIDACLNDYFTESNLNNPNAIATMDGDPVEGLPLFTDLPMMKGQVRIASRNFGVTDPEDIEHAIARGGYEGLNNAIQQKPEDVIAAIKTAGLRGRGGAGFPAGMKWEFCRNAPGDEKYMICNGDEGDPGAFMDRSVLESDPHTVIEGMTIAAYAIGAEHGYIYVRAEYPLAIKRLEKAIAKAEELNLLGDNILDSGFNFHVKIKEGAGAFVCGEETALIASIEGKRGMPNPRPPFPANKGLFGKPSNINNVETLANVPFILREGSDAFAANGTEKSRGTKTFALTGKIVRTGLIEVPLGIPLRDIIFEMGGGIPDGGEFKAVQTGGPSGGCISTDYLDLPVDYERLAEVGAIMGSGGMVVMDNTTCMVDLARYFIDFTQNESCGKCVPCRLGTRQMLMILQSMGRGDSKPGDIDLLIEIGAAVKSGALCGLGQTAPNPVLTTIKYFRDEYDAHVNDHHCPAGQCCGLTKYSISAEKCIGCGACLRACPSDAITGEKKEPHLIDQKKCVHCGACYDVCKFEAVIKE